MVTMDIKAMKAALISGANNLSNNKNRIDAMNVFPVPDGDTGSNMSGTVEYAVNEIKGKDFSLIGDITNQFARGMLLGAKGNSGVILSQIFKGFSVSLQNKEVIKQFDLVSAFIEASKYAYKSVLKPVEGTILTVIRLVSEELSKTITANNNINDVFEIAFKAAKSACEKTPDFLPVLKEVGVTDSGGEGLLMFIEGIYSFIKGKPIEISFQVNVNVGKSFIQGEENYKGQFGYCTELIVELKNIKSFKKEKFQVALEKIGNSIVLVQDDNILKIHIHAKHSGTILTFVQKFGEFLKVKIENMTLQANESHNAKNKIKSKISNGKNEDKNKIVVISCNTGSGIIDEMEQLGTKCIIETGQSSNPSAKDFIDAIDQVKANKIFILPNNSNIILAAQQVVQTTKKRVIVIPTKTQMEGIVAMLNFNPNGDFNDVRESMEDAINDVKTGMVTLAIRSTKIEGTQVKKGEYLAIAERKIIKSTSSKITSAIEICKNLIDNDTEIVTIYYGEDSSKIDAEEIKSFIETNYDAEVEIKSGGQPTYNFLIAFE